VASNHLIDLPFIPNHFWDGEFPAILLKAIAHRTKSAQIENHQDMMANSI
jgi:hypothetical protein